MPRAPQAAIVGCVVGGLSLLLALLCCLMLAHQRRLDLALAVKLKQRESDSTALLAHKHSRMERPPVTTWRPTHKGGYACFLSRALLHGSITHRPSIPPLLSPQSR